MVWEVGIAHPVHYLMRKLEEGRKVTFVWPIFDEALFLIQEHYLWCLLIHDQRLLGVLSIFVHGWLRGRIGPFLFLDQLVCVVSVPQVLRFIMLVDPRSTDLHQLGGFMSMYLPGHTFLAKYSEIFLCKVLWVWEAKQFFILRILSSFTSSNSEAKQVRLEAFVFIKERLPYESTKYILSLNGKGFKPVLLV
jgi:hypothetical protein